MCIYIHNGARGVFWDTDGYGAGDVPLTSGDVPLERRKPLSLECKATGVTSLAGQTLSFFGNGEAKML